MKKYLFIFLILTACTTNAQTYFYKRTSIINGNNVKKVNDDAHYITFNKSVCYDSDKNGISTNSLKLRFIKSSNNILCYYGECYWGTDSYYYVSTSKDRINLKNDNTIYVYERTTPQQNTAKLRNEHTQNNMQIQAPQNNIFNNTQSTNPSLNKKRKVCPACNGKGKGMDQITYTPNYTGQSNDIYCNICKRIMPDHTHHQPICRTCYGKGYIEY